MDANIYFLPPHVDGLVPKAIHHGTTDFKGPMNTFVNVPEYPPASFKDVVRCNFDTFYSPRRVGAFFSHVLRINSSLRQGGSEPGG
jgi:hypothetical protein